MVYVEIKIMLKKFILERKRTIKKYYISGIILTLWNLVTLYLLVDVLNITGFVFFWIMTPINWVFKPFIYFLTGFARKDRGDV